MNGNFQNNYRGGWNHIPFIGFGPGPFNYNYQIPLYWPPFNYNYQIPHRNPANYIDNRPLLHQMGPHYVENRHLPHQMQTYYYDPRHLPHQMPAHYFGPRPLPLQMPEHYVDNGPLPHQMPKNFVYKRDLPHKEQEDSADKKDQKPEDYVDKKCLPHQMTEHYADKLNLPEQTPECCADKRCLPHQMVEEYADKKCPPHETPEDIADKSPLSHQMSDHCADKMNLPQQTPEDDTDKKCLSTESKTSNGEESVHIQKSQIDPIVQPKKVPKFKKVRCLVKNTSHEAIRFKCKEVPNEGAKRKLRDHTSAKDRDFKVENVKHEAPSFQKKKVTAVKSKRKVRVNTDAKGHGSKRETGEAPGGKYMKMSNGIRRSVKNDQPQSTPVESKASAGSTISDGAEYISCDFSATVTPEVPVTYQEFTSPPALESSFEPSGQIDSQTEVEEGKEHLEVQNRGVETNDQPHSISMEFHGPAGSDINTMIGDTSSDSRALVLAPPQSPIAFQIPTPVDIIQTEMSESEIHNEVQNDIVDSNDQQCSISMGLHDPSGSMTNNQTKIVNFDSAAIEIVIEVEPLASAWPDAAGTSFEPLTELGLHTETEPRVSEAVGYIESQHPTEETDIEIGAASEVSVETETEEGGSQVEVEMDVLASELGKIHFPQVSVCLTCGDEGFEEAIVYCSKCGDYAMHRYCLEGPVVFTDDVIWFCKDCEKEILDADYLDNETAVSEKCEVDSSKKCATFVNPQPVVDPIWRGSLQVFNKSFDKMTRLMGHLSTLACPKVLEETRHLPNVLYGDLVQRSTVWPESFKKFGTNNLSIGLYFFPQNERDSSDMVSPCEIKVSAVYLAEASFAANVERYYDQLVDEMISNDLAIRVWVEKAELLIFSSTMLPSQYKRFQSKYYLWGIFKRKQEPLV